MITFSRARAHARTGAPAHAHRDAERGPRGGLRGGGLAARTRRTRWVAGLAMAGFTAAAAVISYNDGLFLIRFAGVVGWIAYVYPLLPDGLIVISSASLYEAALTKRDRPKWAMTGLIFGASLTLAMNLGAGLAVSPLLALADSVVPVVFFFALEILIGLIRRAQIAAPRAAPADTPRATPAVAPVARQTQVRQTGASQRNAKARQLLIANPGMALADVAAQSGVSTRTASRIKSGLPVLRVAGHDG